MSLLISDLAPLRQPAFRRYVVASSLAYVCLWIYMTAVSWTLLSMSDSAAVLGILLMAMTLPLPLAAVPAGALTDRIGPRDLMALALGAEAVCILMTVLAAASGFLSVPLILLIAVAFGIADGFVIVPSQVLVGRLVEPAQMGSAIGLGMLAIGFGRIAGGPVGGGLVALAGASVALAPAAAGLALAAVVLRRLPRLEGIGGENRLSRADVAEGVGWIRRTVATRPVLLMAALTALFVWPYLGLLAVVTRDLLGGDPAVLGLLTAAGGVGAIIAALLMGVVVRRVGAGRLLVAAVTGAAVALLALGLTRWLPGALALSLVLNGMLITYTAMSSLLLQSMAPLMMRGRVMSIYGFISFGVMPLGMVGAGLGADAFGVGAVLVMMGLVALAGAASIVIVDSRSHALGDLLRRDPERVGHVTVSPVATAEPVPPLAEPGATASGPAGPPDPTVDVPAMSLDR